MSSTNQRLLWWLALAILAAGLLYTMTSLALYGFGPPLHDKGFPLLNQMRLISFGDLRWVTATSECNVDLSSLYRGRVQGCDAFGRAGIGYPPLSIWLFRLVGFPAAWTGILGFATGLLFLISSGWILVKTCRNALLTILIAGLLIWGYPVQIGLERMNIDFLIFLLILLHCYFLSQPPAVWQGLVGLGLSMLNVGMKIYPIFGYAALLALLQPIASWRQRRDHHPRSHALLIITGCVIGLITAAPIIMGNDALPAGSVSAGEGGIGSHGLKAFGYLNLDLISLVGLQPARLLIKLLFALKLSSLFLGFMVTMRLQLGRLLGESLSTLAPERLSRQITYLAISMTSIWLGCYVATISYDYRGIFLLPVIGLLSNCCLISTNKWQKIYGSLLCCSAIIPGLMTSTYIALSLWGPMAKFIHELISEFLLLPLFAASTAAILMQFLGLPSELRLAAPPAPAPALRDPYR